MRYLKSLLTLCFLTTIQFVFAQNTEQEPNNECWVILMDGKLLKADSVGYSSERLSLYRGKKRHPERAKKLYSIYDNYEIFSVQTPTVQSIMYLPNKDEIDVISMGEYLNGRKVAQENFKKWPVYVLGLGTGVAAGATINSSIPAVSSSIAASILYMNLPIVGHKHLKAQESKLGRKGYKKEIRSSRYLPFLLTNLVGVVVGLSIAAN